MENIRYAKSIESNAQKSLNNAKKKRSGFLHLIRSKKNTETIKSAQNRSKNRVGNFKII